MMISAIFRRKHVTAALPLVHCRGFAASRRAEARCSVLGTGQIGSAVCRGLLKQGHEVRFHDKFSTNRSALSAEGAAWQDSASDLVSEVDVFITALPGPPQVKEAVDDGGLLANLPVGSTWIDHTTTDHTESIRYANEAKERGVKFLEAPLTGGLELLRAGNMTVLVGGDEALLAEHSPLMSSYAKTILRMGPIGHAGVVKIISNMLCASHLVAAGEALLMAKKLGVEMRPFFDGIRASAGNSYVFETEAPLAFNGSYDPGFAIALHLKDLNIGRELSRSADCKIPLHDLAEELYKETAAAYGPDVGSSHPMKLAAERHNTSLECPGFDGWTYSVETVEGGSYGVVQKIPGDAGTS